MDLAVIISSLSLAVAVGGFFWNRHTWKMARRSDVRVIAQEYSGSARVHRSGQVDQVEHVIAVRVFNHGERPEYVMWTGLQTAAGENLVDERPTTSTVVDDPPPVPREIPPRGQLFTQFKLAPSKLDEGFVGCAVLATGETIYSVPTMLESDFEEFGAAVARRIRETTRGDSG